MTVRRRMGWGLADQILSSLSNILMTLAVARVSTVSEFGLFSVGLTVLTVSLTLTRGFLGSRISLLSTDTVKVRTESCLAAGAALILGLSTAGLLVVLGLLLSGAQSIFALAVAAPFLLVQDIGRYFCMTAGTPRRATASDGLWAGGSLTIFGATFVGQDSLSSTTVVLIWAGLAVLAMLMIYVPFRLKPDVSGIRVWLRHELRDRLRYGTEALAGSATSLVIVGGATLLLGPAAAAALRGASAILGPLNVVMSVVPIAVIPEVRRRGTLATESIWPLFRKLAFPMSLIALLVGAGGFLLPDWAGEILLGSTWSVVQPLLPFTAFEYAAIAWMAASTGCLRVQGRSYGLLQLRFVLMAASIVFAAGLSLLTGSAQGVAAGLALGALVTAVIGRYVVRHGRWHRTESTDPTRVM